MTGRLVLQVRKPIYVSSLLKLPKTAPTSRGGSFSDIVLTIPLTELHGDCRIRRSDNRLMRANTMGATILVELEPSAAGRLGKLFSTDSQVVGRPGEGL